MILMLIIIISYHHQHHHHHHYGDHSVLTDNVEGVGVPRGGGEVSLGLVSNLNILITLILLDHHDPDLTQTLVIIVIMIM